MQTIEQYVNEQTAQQSGIPLETFYDFLNQQEEQPTAKSFASLEPTTMEMTKEQKQKQLIIGLSFGLFALILLTVAIASLRKK